MVRINDFEIINLVHILQNIITRTNFTKESSNLSHLEALLTAAIQCVERFKKCF